MGHHMARVKQKPEMTVTEEYYKGACMKMLTVAIVEGIAVVALLGLWIYETMECAVK